MRYFGYAFGASLVPLYFLIFHVSWRRDRILAFLNPYADRQKTGFHIIQSLIAVGIGGVTGTGLMEGQAEAVLSAGATHRFYFCGHGEELDWWERWPWWRCSRSFCGAGCGPRGGLKMCSGDIWRWDYEHGSAAGIHQYERGARQ